MTATGSTDPEIVVEDADDALLVGVDTDECSAAAWLDAGADPDDVSDALASLESELRHSARLNGGAQA